MRKVFAIARGSLLRTIRDRKALAVLLLMPMILIGILGSALGAMMGTAKINPFKVLVVNEDQPARPPLPQGTPPAAAAQVPELHFGKVLVDEVYGNDRVQAIIATETMTDLQAAKDRVLAKKAVAVVFVPADFTKESLNGQPASVQVYTDPGQPTQAGIVMQITRSFTEGVASGVLSGRLRGETVPQAPLPELKEIPSGTRLVTAMQYYAAAMAVMFMVMTAFGRAKDLIDERQDGTLARILLSPTSRASVVAGQALGSVTVLMAQFIVLMLGTHLIFQVYWGPLLPALALGLAFAAASAGIALACAGLLNDPRAADAATGVVGMLFAALSGGMAPLYVFPDTLKQVARFIPNYWGLQGFHDQMAGLGAEAALAPIAILAAIGMVSGGLGAWRLASR